ncbi:MAG: hypothetical protein QM811_22925 [Pirellulales bacterium]
MFPLVEASSRASVNNTKRIIESLVVSHGFKQLRGERRLGLLIA